MTQTDVEVLKAVLGDQESRRCLSERIIPRNIRHLINFEEPHRLSALHIMMQGVLAAWASEPGHPKSREAREALGLASIPAVAKCEVATRSVIRQALGLETRHGVTTESPEMFCNATATELGIESLDEEAAVKALVESICSGDAAASPDEKTVIKGFRALDLMLTKT